jgi:hypothetical protein
VRVTYVGRSEARKIPWLKCCNVLDIDNIRFFLLSNCLLLVCRNRRQSLRKTCLYICRHKASEARFRVFESRAVSRQSVCIRKVLRPAMPTQVFRPMVESFRSAKFAPHSFLQPPRLLHSSKLNPLLLTTELSSQITYFTLHQKTKTPRPLAQAAVFQHCNVFILYYQNDERAKIGKFITELWSPGEIKCVTPAPWLFLSPTLLLLLLSVPGHPRTGLMYTQVQCMRTLTCVSVARDSGARPCADVRWQSCSKVAELGLVRGCIA